MGGIWSLGKADGHRELLSLPTCPPSWAGGGDSQAGKGLLEVHREQGQCVFSLVLQMPNPKKK